MGTMRGFARALSGVAVATSTVTAAAELPPVTVAQAAPPVSRLDTPGKAGMVGIIAFGATPTWPPTWPRTAPCHPIQ